MLLQAHRRPLLHGPLKKSTQRYRRLPLVARVTQYDRQTTHWRAVNVSEGGIFVRAAPTLPCDTEVEIAFCLPGSDVDLVTRARVVWTNDANAPDYDPRIPYGMGMEFQGLNPVFRELIRRYVDAGLNEQEV